MYTIQYVQSIVDDLAEWRVFERRRILDHIEQQLSQQPNVETQHKKILRGLTPPWEHVQPVWQLRIGEYRVFYDVDEAVALVTVRAIRQKPPHKTTAEIL